MSNYWDLYREKQKAFIANGGNIDSYTGYEIMELGEYVATDENTVFNMLFKAMQKGNRLAAFYCLTAAVKNGGIEIDGHLYDAYEICRLGAEIGCPDSEYNMGMLLGMQHKYSEALSYYRRAAENIKGNVNGMSRLAMFYANGVGVKKSPEIAAYWVFCKPKEGDIDPSTEEELENTARVLSEELDYITVVDNQYSFDVETVARRAAEAGERDAWVSLGYNEKDKKKQKEYFLKAAKLGSHAGQMYYAAVCKEEGDEDSFVKYALMACEQGQALAQQDYSMYLLEKGKPEEAKKWLEAIVNHSSNTLHDIELWAYSELAYIFYNEGNKERALFCWKSTDGKIKPRQSVDWNELEKELYPSQNLNTDERVQKVERSCLYFLLAVLIVVIFLLYKFFDWLETIL